MAQQAGQCHHLPGPAGRPTYIAYRGITTTERLQYILVGFQLTVLVVFAVAAIIESEGSGTGLEFSWSWFSPAGLTTSAVVAGLSGSIFAFWGWDSALTLSEETKDAQTTSGRAAILAVVSILCTYLLVSIAVIMYAGVGDTGVGLANPDIADNVFGALAQPVLGEPWYLLLFLAVLASSAASLVSTFLPTSRTLLAMVLRRTARAVRGHQPPLPDPVVLDHRGGRRCGCLLHDPDLPEPQRPAGHGVLHRHHDLLLLRADSVRLCVVLQARTVHESGQRGVQTVVAPRGRPHAHLRLRGHPQGRLLTGLRQWRRDSGVGLVFILGVGLILFGFVLIAVLRRSHPAFFRGETLRKETPELTAG